MKISEQIAVAIFKPKSLSEKSKSIVQLRSEVEALINQRVIEELERILSEKNVFGEQLLQTEDVLLKRIKELKQD